jgi:hypothetical protein
MILSSPRRRFASLCYLALASIATVICLQGCSSEPPPLVDRSIAVPVVPSPQRPNRPQEAFFPPPQPVKAPEPCPAFPITEEQKAAIIEKFMQAYGGTNTTPRMLLFINRSLVDENTGLNIAGRVVSATKGTNGTTINENDSYRSVIRTNMSLADQQVVSDLETAFMYPFRLAGVPFVDQQTATQMIPNLKLSDLMDKTDSEASRKDREALSKYVDIVIRCLVEFRPIANSGTPPMCVTDIRVTAIRLNNVQILGQTSSAKALAGVKEDTVARCFTWQEITEGTAVKLMEDMVLLGNRNR